MTPSRPPLEVLGRLDLDFALGVEEPRTLAVDLQGAAIVVRLTDLAAAWALLRRGPAPRRRWLRRLDAELRAADLSLRVEIRERVVGRLGAGSRAGLLGRLLRLAPLEVSPGAILRLLAARA